MFFKCKLAFKDFLTLRAWQGGYCHWVHVRLVCQHSFLSDKSLSTEITKNHSGRFRIGCFFTSNGNERMNGWMSGFYVIIQSCLCVVLFWARQAGKLLGLFSMVSCVMAEKILWCHLGPTQTTPNSEVRIRIHQRA